MNRSKLIFTIVFFVMIAFCVNLNGESYEIEWVRTYNGGGNEKGEAVALDTSGNVYVTGEEYQLSTGGYYNIWTRKYDSDGYEIWTSTYNSPGNSDDYSYDIAVDTSMNVYITGKIYRYDIGQNYNVVTRKYDSDGYEIWTSTYDNPEHKSDVGLGIAINSAHEVYVTGTSRRVNIYTYSYIWSRKYDSNGYTVWTSTYIPSSGDSASSHDIAADDSGNAYITGTEFTSDQGYNVLVRKYDPDGYEIWTSTYNSMGNTSSIGSGIALDNSGNVFVTGTDYRNDIGQGYNIWTRKYDNDGYEIWTSTYNSPYNSGDYGRNITLDSIGNVYVVGYIDRNDLGQGNDIWVRKYDNDGNVLCTTTYHSDENYHEYGYDIAVDNDENFYVTGWVSKPGGMDVWTGKFVLRNSISGSISDQYGSPIEGVVVMLSGDSSTSTVTGSSGNYTFDYIQAGSTYVITPSYAHCSEFTPSERTYINISGDITDADFAGALNQWSISGVITDGTDPLMGVRVDLSGVETGTLMTSSTGYYKFGSLNAGATYAILPSRTHYVFTPSDRIYGELGNNITDADFSATLNQWSISGVITDGAVPLSGVTVDLTGAQTAALTSSATGYFKFNGLDAGATYIVTPSCIHCSGFTPIDRTYTELNGEITDADFMGTLNQWSISGIISDGLDSLEGITIDVTVAETASLATSSTGYYILTNLNAGSTYTITPSNTNYIFTPTDKIYTELDSDMSDADFTGTLNQWSISGIITDGTDPLVGIRLDLSGAETAALTTSATGYYAFNDLNAGATYKITPSFEQYYNFIPESAIFSELGADEIQDFIGDKTFAESLDSVSVYPNPLNVNENDSITIVNLTENCTIKIYSISGEKIIDKELNQIEFQWDLLNMDGDRVMSGVYIYIIENTFGERKEGKIAVIR